MASITQKQAIEKAQQKLLAFAHIIHRNFEIANHHKRIAEVLEDMADPNTPPRRVLLSMPPRHTKSMLINETFVPWYFGKHPDAQIILATNAASLSKKFGRKIRNTIESKNFAAVFPDTHITKDSRSATEFDTESYGEFFATSVDAQGTGRNAKDLIIIDDPIKDWREALSKTKQETLYDWFQSVIGTRIEKTTNVIVVHTRWCEDDLIGQLIKQEAEEWEVISLPAIDDLGLPLWSKFGKAFYEKKKRELGAIKFASLYQQQPIDLTDSLIDVAWFQDYERLPEDFQIVQSWDTANKDGLNNDKTACVTAAVSGSQVFILDVYTGKLKYPDLKRKVYSHAARFNPDIILIEDKASGISLIQDCKEDKEFVWSIKPIEPKGDKILRMSTASPTIECGDVLLPEKTSNVKWIDDFLIDIGRFPRSGRDTGDALSQLLNYMKNGRRNHIDLGKLNIPILTKAGGMFS